MRTTLSYELTVYYNRGLNDTLDKLLNDDQRQEMDLAATNMSPHSLLGAHHESTIPSRMLIP